MDSPEGGVGMTHPPARQSESLGRFGPIYGALRARLGALDAAGYAAGLAGSPTRLGASRNSRRST